DYYGQGRHAKVVAPYSKDFLSASGKYRSENPLTARDGWHEFYTGSRVTEVKDIEFPKLLDPVDDLQPTTVITHVTRAADGKMTVQGTTADNGTIKRVVVNGKEARATAPNFTRWEIILDKASKLEAHAEDEAGNVEKNPHVVLASHAPKRAAAQGPTELPAPITPEQFEKVHKLLKPHPGESRWREIPWLTSLWEARRKAAAEGKPIVVWTGSGGGPARPTRNA